MLASEANDLAVGLARRFEGFRPEAYLDPVGIPTIGYGFTRYADGQSVRIGDPVLLPAAAEELLRILMARTVVSIFRLAPTANTPGWLAALSDFAYNLGYARFAGSTLCRTVSRGRWDAAPAEFRKWRFAGGKILPGLVLRREAEIALLN